jgi:hypothetical protein
LNTQQTDKNPGPDLGHVENVWHVNGTPTLHILIIESMAIQIYMYMYKQAKKKLVQFLFHSKRKHPIIKMNDNIIMDFQILLRTKYVPSLVKIH